jgi:DNA-binding HxlR family transcriptional regulator
MMGGMARERDTAHEPRVCDAALSRAFEFLGKRWNGVLLGTLLEGPAGFSELRRLVAGISDSVLSDRLAELTKAGLVQRSVREGPPVTVDYRLTPAGEALLPALRELGTWAADNLPEACSGS